MEDDLTRSLRWANRILLCVLPQRDADVVVGDLAEEYGLRAKSGSASCASRWYWGQVSRSIPPLLWAPVQRGGVFATVGASVGALMVQATVELASKSAISSLLVVDARAAAILTAVVAIPTLVLVSYLAARIRPGAAIVLTALVTVAVVIQLMVNGYGMPLWKQLAALLIGPSAAFTGSVLSLRRR